MAEYNNQVQKLADDVKFLSDYVKFILIKIEILQKSHEKQLSESAEKIIVLINELNNYSEISKNLENTIKVKIDNCIIL